LTRNAMGCLDSGLRATPEHSEREQAHRPRSTNFRSSRFQGIASDSTWLLSHRRSGGRGGVMSLLILLATMREMEWL
jgi:hypothetical protein